jgi:hypothetical protein
MRTPVGVQFEVSIDGTPRTYCVDKTIAIEAAENSSASTAQCRHGGELRDQRGGRGRASPKGRCRLVAVAVCALLFVVQDQPHSTRTGRHLFKSFASTAILPEARMSSRRRS